MGRGLLFIFCHYSPSVPRRRIAPLLGNGSDGVAVPMNALMKIIEWVLLSHIQSLYSEGICSRWLVEQARSYPPILAIQAYGSQDAPKS